MRREKETVYWEYLRECLNRAGREMPGQIVTIDELAARFGLKVTPSFRKRMKQAVRLSLLWYVPPFAKSNPRKSEFQIPELHQAGIPF